jgi:hypothetical protein
MKTGRVFIVMALCLSLLFGATSCLVLVPGNKGKHKGWTKNSNNPHHPRTTNPGHTKGKIKN